MAGKLSAITFLPSANIFISQSDAHHVRKWQAMMKDPVYDILNGRPDTDQISGLFPRPTGEPAFDRELIRENIKKLKTVPEIDTGNSFLDLSIKTGLAHIDATFQGDHPKYGVGTYSRTEHDGFPPIIIAAVDALSAWGINGRATSLFKYWLNHFVKENGTIDYYGPSISEYGQLLHTARILNDRSGSDGWLDEGFSKLNRLADYLLQLHSSATGEEGLISGVPEADTRDKVGKYFHNNAWVVKGLEQWTILCEKTHLKPLVSIDIIRKSAQELKKNILSVIQKTWPEESADWWLPARPGDIPRPHNLTDGNEASYTNYRYWPELLSSGILPADLANRLVNARLNGGGQFCGMTRFMDWFDDWPLADYLYGLWSLGRRNDFLLSLYGHIAYHQCEGHLTAYEQVSFPGDPKGSKRADYCLPCQLVPARAGRLINNI